MKKYGIYIIVLLCGVAVFFLQFSYKRTFEPYSFYQVYLDDEEIGIIKSKDEFDKYVKSQGEVVRNQVSDYTKKNERINNFYGVLKTSIGRTNKYYSVYSTLLIYQNIMNYLDNNVDSRGVIKGNKEEVIDFFNRLSSDIKGNSIIEDNKITDYESLIDGLDNKIKVNSNILFELIYSYKDNLQLTTSQNSMLDDYKNNNLKDISYSKYLYMKDYIDKYSAYMYADNIYEPLGINIKMFNTYTDNAKEVKDVYASIIKRKPCTIEGYKFRIKKSASNRINVNTLLGAQAQADYNLVNKDNSNDIIIYVTDDKIFKKAVEEYINVFVGKDVYDAYKANKQKEIETTGTKVNNIYVEEDITIKKTNVSIEEKIYNNETDLASYLLYGEDKKSSIVRASASDNISDLAYKYGISIEEFFLSNPSFNSLNNMFYDGQEITIMKVNPKISLIVEQTQVEDKIVQYSVVEKYDNMMLSGNEYVEQKGENGVMRVSQNLKIKNGATQVVTPISNVTIKSPRDKIVLVGTKQVPTVGSTGSWGWPTCKGYTITSHFGYRQYPFGGGRELHAGLDIAGCSYGSPIYASNNGTIYNISSTKWNYGNSIIIDHHNGYYTLYGHMAGFNKALKKGSTVSRGQVIGYMGHTGAATGTHLHFEIRVGSPKYSAVVNPYPYLMKR